MKHLIITATGVDMKGGRVPAVEKVTATEIATLAAEKVIDARALHLVAVAAAVPRPPVPVALAPSVRFSRGVRRQFTDRHQVPLPVAALLLRCAVPIGAARRSPLAGDTPQGETREP